MLAVLAAVVSGCATEPGQSSAPDAAPGASATTSTYPPSTPPPAPPTAIPATADSSCTSTTLGGGPVDLTATTVTAVPEGAKVTMTYSGALPAKGHSAWTLLARNPAGEAVQLTVDVTDGAPSAFYWFSYVGGTTHPMAGPPDVSVPGRLVMLLPREALDALGPTWWWTSSLQVDGAPPDTCP